MDSDFIINKEIFLKTNRLSLESHYDVHPKVNTSISRESDKVLLDLSSKLGKKSKKMPVGGLPKFSPRIKSMSNHISSTR